MTVAPQRFHQLASEALIKGRRAVDVGADPTSAIGTAYRRLLIRDPVPMETDDEVLRDLGEAAAAMPGNKHLLCGRQSYVSRSYRRS